MKKPMIVMTSLLLIFCIIYGYSNNSGVEASEPSYKQVVSVVDFEPGDETTEEGVESDTQSSQSSAETFVAGEGAGAQSSSQGSSQSTGTGTENGTGNSSSSESSGGNIFNGQSGKDAADELVKSSEPDILGEDYQFGDDILQTDQTTEGFFQHIYNKTWEAFTGVQKLFAVIVLFCFIVSAIMTLISIFGKKEKVLWYAFSMLLCLIILLCIIYAPQIASAFNKWFVTT